MISLDYVLTSLVPIFIFFYFLYPEIKKSLGRRRKVVLQAIIFLTVSTPFLLDYNISYYFQYVSSLPPLVNEAFVYLILLLFSLSFILLGRALYDCSIFKLGFYFLLFLTITVMSEKVLIVILNITAEDIWANEIFFSVFIILNDMLNFFIISVLRKLNDSINQKKPLFTRDFWISITINLFFITLGILVFSDLYQLSLASEEISYVSLAIVILLFLVGVSIGFDYYLKVIEREQEGKKATYISTIKCEYYQHQLENQEKFNRIYHDLKNHLLLLEDRQGLDKERKALSFELREKISFFEQGIHSGNDFLDIILNDKLNYSKENAIQVDMKVDFTDGGFLEALDISTIFGNIFDNAIEECLRNNRKNHIIFKIEKRNNMIVILIKNPTDMKLDKFKQQKSAKQDKSLHGIGLKNVRKSLMKYGGDYHIKIEENEFIFHGIIPILQKHN